MDIEDKVILFFKKETSINNLNINSIINSIKLGIFDIEAEDLMDKYFETFEIDKNGFNIENYFQYPNYSFRNLFILKYFFKQEKLKEKEKLTINHLVNVAIEKKWFEPKKL